MLESGDLSIPQSDSAVSKSVNTSRANCGGTWYSMYNGLQPDIQINNGTAEPNTEPEVQTGSYICTLTKHHNEVTITRSGSV